jgi:hypothetical protein
MYINSDKHYKRAAMTRIRTPYRSKVCWCIYNATPRFYNECWSCKRKMKYHTNEEAKRTALRASRRTSSLIHSYSCSYCDFYHIGHVGRRY